MAVLSPADSIFGKLRPALLLALGVYHFVRVSLRVALIERNPLGLLDISRLRHEGFAQLWIASGQAMSEEMPDGTIDVLKQVQGTVLDVGSGSGAMLYGFDPTRIRTLYSAEPSVHLHEDLRRSSEKLGLAGKHHILSCGAERASLLPTLTKAGLLKDERPEGVFDDIVCCRVLCSVPHLKDTVETLCSLLKPGGRLSVCEHIANPWRTPQGSFIARVLQRVYSYMGWQFFMAGCSLNNDTLTILKEAGGGSTWESTNLWTVDPTSAVPFIVGYLTKKS